MAKDPAFLFYSDNFMSGTMFLTDEQVGKYIRLLCAQHLTGHLSEKDMLKICRSHDEDIFNKFSKDQTGKFFNERLEIEINKRKAFSDSRSKNRNSNKKQVSNISKTSVKHLEDENENGNEYVINNNNEEKSDFERWGDMIVNQEDQYWQQMKGRLVLNREMESFISVAIRNNWKLETQQKFRLALKGFELNKYDSKKESANKYKVQ